MNVTSFDLFTIEEINATSMQMQTLEQINDLQTGLCIANNVFMLSVLRDGGTCAAYFGDDMQLSALRKYINSDVIVKLLSRFEDYDIENVITQETGVSFLRLTGVGVRADDGKLLGVGVLIGIIDEGREEYIPEVLPRTSEISYNNTVALFTKMAKHYFHEKLHNLMLENRMNSAAETGKQLEEQLNKNEVITSILKMLESDNDFAKIAEDAIIDTVSFLNISNGFLIRLNPDGSSIEMICEHSKQGAIQYHDSFSKLTKADFPFFNGKTYTISTDTSLPEDFERFFNTYSMQAAVFLPLSISGNTGMYLVFDVQGDKHSWTVDELKFLNDVKRVLQTILVKRITKNSLASSYTALENILEHAGCGICVDDTDTRELLFVNDTIKEMFESESDMKDFERVLAETSLSVLTIDDYKADSTGRWYDITFSTITWVDGREVRLTTVYDITSVKEYQKQIERQSSVDFLTGLYNRRRLEDDLREEVRMAVRAAKQGALLYFDLDDFKNINDGLGHGVGDMLLKDVASALKRIGGETMGAYRLGGDEFGLLVPHEEYDNLDEIIQAVQKVFRHSWTIGGTECYCTMSMGAVSFPEDGVEVDTILQRADIALSYAKNNGKNRVETFNKDVSVNSARRLDVEKCLRDAVAGGCKEFEVYYQPLVNISQPGNPCCGAEALVRWNSKKLGFMNPAEFIPLAEYLGLIIPIGEHVLIQACHRCKYWNDFGHPEYKVNVNLSVVQLVQKDIVDVVANALKVTGVNPNNLTLEVTEGLAINDIESMKAILFGIKELGVRVALDDFGTGYSSLNYIRSMPLDVIKIDKCFIDGVGQDGFSDAFVKTVSRLADAIDVNVCVEGVENQSQREALDEMDVDIIQGYLYDKPLKQDEFENKYLI